MRIHSDTITNRHIIDAASLARVEFDRWEDKGSRTRDHAFDVTLTGESKRRPNDRGASRGTGKFAATWDQWGVFLGFLFDIDPDMVTPYYENARDFHYKTDGRFEDGWPEDAHGDHVFRYFNGMQRCSKCSAAQRYI